MEEIPYNYKYISHDLAKDNLAHMNKILIWTPNFFKIAIDGYRRKK